jgi:putative ATP-binding cassette transporter
MRLIGRQTWSRFATVARPFLTSEVRWRAGGLFALLVALLLAVSGLNVFNSYVNRDWMTALERQRAGPFFALTLVYAGTFVLLTAAAVSLRFTEETLGLLWRRWLTGT